jgi:hypothetical protein
MKTFIFVLVIGLAILFSGGIFQLIWNDAIVHIFDLKEISLVHSIELTVGIRLLFQTFEFET